MRAAASHDVSRTWPQFYNEHRPHIALCNQPLATVRRAWLDSDNITARLTASLIIEFRRRSQYSSLNEMQSKSRKMRYL